MLKGVTHVMIIACYHPLPLSACMVYFDLVSILFGTSIPTSFIILVKMFLHFICSYSHVFTDLVLTEYDETEITTICQNDNPIFGNVMRPYLY